jgi:CHAD domain-containing protein
MMDSSTTLLDRPDPPAVTVEPLGAHSTTRAVVGSALASAASSIGARDRGLRQYGDPEDVHQARIALRRLRAELRTLRPVLVRSWVEELNTELKWLAGVLGEIRDADVWLEQLDAHVLRMPAADIPAGRALIGRLRQERDVARGRLSEALASDRYRALVAQIADGSTDPPMKEGDPRSDAPARTVLPGLVARRWRQLRQGVAELDDDPSDEALHEIRKRAKKLRYGAEAAAPVLGHQAARLAKVAHDMQDTLGEIHDAAEMERWLRHQVLETGSLTTALAAGEIVERQRQRHDRYRSQWPHVWRHGRKKRYRRWLHAAKH